MPRARRTVPSAQKLIRIDSELLGKIELLMIDPMTAKPKMGAFSALVERLLRNWLEQEIRQYQNHYPLEILDND